jgi:hypothetical protein
MKKHLTFLFLVCCGVALVATPASATILFAGGEDLDFMSIGSPIGVNTSNCYNSTYARESVYTTNNSGAYYLVTPVFTSSSTVWAHFDFSSCTGNGANQNIPWVVFNDSSGVTRIYLQFANGSAPAPVKIYKENAALTSTLLATSTSTIFFNSLGTIDIYINYGVSGTITVYQNGSQIVTYSGDTTTDGNTALAQLELGSAVTNNTFYSQVIVSTTDSRTMHLATITPVANGNTMAWTGAVGNINTASYNDADTISSAASGQIGEFTASALPSGTFSIQAVVQSARAEATTGGPQNLKFDTRTGGTSYQSANQTLSTAFALYQYIWATNPNTSVAWTTSDLGAAGFNLGVESQT